MNAITMFMAPAMKTTIGQAGNGITSLTTKDRDLNHFEKLLRKTEANNHSLRMSPDGDLNHDFTKIVSEKEMQAEDVSEEVYAENAGEVEAIDMVKVKLSMLNIDTLKAILTSLATSEDISSEALQLLEKMEGMLNSLQKEDSNFQLVHLASEELLAAMLQEYERLEVTEELQAENLLWIQSFFQTVTNNIQSVSDTTAITDSELQQQMQQMITRIEALLQQINSQADVTKAAPKLLELLQEWHQLLSKSGGELNKQVNHIFDDKQLPKIWRELTQAFEKRIGWGGQKQYNHEAKVTTNDISRWLGRILEANNHVEKTVYQPAVSAQSMPISKVEQFVIHVNQTQSHQSVDKQLVEQFQKIMDANKIMSLQNTRGQLAITLKPVNLGEMLVRFTQVNGEMLVKILVTTDAAKKMLEGNMQQLRSMFSPQQVVVERQEVIVTQNQESQKGEERNEQNSAGEEDANANQQEQQGDDAFSSIYEELVLNEKV